MYIVYVYTMYSTYMYMYSVYVYTYTIVYSVYVKNTLHCAVCSLSYPIQLSSFHHWSFGATSSYLAVV